MNELVIFYMKFPNFYSKLDILGKTLVYNHITC